MLENSEKLGGFEILCLKNWGKIIWGPGTDGMSEIMI